MNPSRTMSLKHSRQWRNQLTPLLRATEDARTQFVRAADAWAEHPCLSNQATLRTAATDAMSAWLRLVEAQDAYLRQTVLAAHRARKG